METMLANEPAKYLDKAQLEGLIKIAGVDGTREILDAFWSSTSNLIDLMREHVENSDIQNAAATAHAIKGSAANVGANSLHEKVQLFETFLRTQNLMTASDVESIAQLFEETRAVFLEELERF